MKHLLPRRVSGIQRHAIPPLFRCGSCLVRRNELTTSKNVTDCVLMLGLEDPLSRLIYKGT